MDGTLGRHRGMVLAKFSAAILKHRPKPTGGWTQWHSPLTPALRSQKQMELCELQINLVYITIPRPATAT